MLERPHYVALGIAVLLAAALLSLPARKADRLKLAVGGSFLPLFGAASSAGHVLDQAAEALMPRRALLQRLAALERENQTLRLQLTQSDEALRENAQLREALGYRRRAPWKLLPAQVIGRDPANWWRSCHIDVGSRDGIQPDMPVVCADGLVGRVAAVGLARSRVTLVGDPKCRVSVLIRETGEFGVLNADSGGTLDPTLAVVGFLPAKSSVKPGQTLITSGQAIFPKGIPVGTVLDARPVGNGLNLEARVKLAVDTSRLEHVFVILQ
jgi:rod shape-determining protein MreC